MDYKNLIEIPVNLEGKLYRSPMPFARFDVEGTTFKEYLDAGITTVVMLVEEGEDYYHTGKDLHEEYASQNIDVIHYPIRDFDTPKDHESLKKVLGSVATICKDGESVAVHCLAGRGRTGMFIALLTRQILDLGGEEAITYVRQFFPAIETKEQEELVKEFVQDG